MNKRLHFYFSLNLILALLATAISTAQEKEPSISFGNDIRPILENNCVECHGPVEPEGGFRIDNRDDAMDYIEAGDSENSDLYQYLISDDEEKLMPPPDAGGPLDDSDIRSVKTWIDEGADWPDGVELTDRSGDEQNETEDDVAIAIDRPENDQPSIYRAIGALHPATTHIPVGLLLASGLFALLSLRGNFVMSDCAYYCLWLGTLGAIAACLTGWWFALVEHPTEYVGAFEDLRNMDHKLFWHRSSAIAATVFALLLALFAASARNRDPDDGVSWKLGLILLALGIGYVGHQGGELTWKASHYDELFEVINKYIPGLSGQQDQLENEQSPPNENAAEEDSEASGKSSEEDQESPEDTESTSRYGERMFRIRQNA